MPVRRRAAKARTRRVSDEPLRAAGLLRDAERHVRTALAVGADEAEAFVLAGRGASLRIEKGSLTNGSVGEERGVALTVEKKGRRGFAYFTEDADAKTAARRALASARILGPSPGLAEKVALKPVSGLFDAKLARWSTEAAIEAAVAMMDAARGRAPDAVIAGGGLGWGTEAYALATSCGFKGAVEGTSLGGSLHLVLREADATATGFDYVSSRALKGVDFAGCGREAADLAMRSRRPKRVEGGPQTVVFRPTALDGLFEFLFARAVLGETAHAGQSVFSGRLGARVMPEAWSLVDDPRRRGGAMSAPFDDEGVPTRKVAIVKKGLLATFLDDRDTAARHGAKPSGVAVRAERMSSDRSFRAPPRAVGRNVTLEGPASDEAALLAGIRRGVLVHDAMGAHTANAASGDFAVSSSTLFEIRDGEVAGPLKGAMVSGNFPDALAKLEAAGRDVRPLGGAFSPLAMYLPSLRVGGLRVTG
ncbi:MAG TPA: TldD/PmbA family protein [Candidatus Thermoplasmatota archaeon]|nr:TldD/PmbA family protein [Candidatus Thermoplasmatota archaeon]